MTPSNLMVAMMILAFFLIPFAAYWIGYERGQAKTWGDVAGKWVEANNKIRQYNTAIAHVNKIEAKLRAKYPDG